MQHQIDVQGLKGKGKMMLQANYKKKCKGPLIVSIVLIIGVLAYCKYTNMLIDLWNQMRGLVGNKRIDTLKLIVPLGISYYTFSSVGYLLDIYWRKKKYEKNFLRNKGKAIDSIVYKIKKYDTSLDSEIRKYKKSNGIEEYNRIYDIVEKRYRRDINMLVLNSIDSNIVEQISVEEEGKYYGEYLTQKKKQIIHGVFSKMGIV